MALSGLQIFQLLPKTNCKDCGCPTCLAFAMKVATKTASIEDCPDASDEAKTKLGAAAEPPIRTLKVGAGAAALELGGETVSYRHEKTFLRPTAIGIRLRDTDDIASKMGEIAAYEVQRVGERLAVDMIALQAAGGDFVGAAKTIASSWAGPVLLDCGDVGLLRGAAEALRGRSPILRPGNCDDLAGLVELAKATKSVLVLNGASAGELNDLGERAVAAGWRELLLELDTTSASKRLQEQTIIRRAALKGVKGLGYPVLMSVAGEDVDNAGVIAICKYASVLVLDELDAAHLYPLLTLRQSIYTDPQKPIQVEPGIYTIGAPGATSPLFLTTNFSLTYFMVAGEIENSGLSAHLVVHDCDGMSVLTAWAAGKFTGTKVAEFIKAADIPPGEPGRKIVIPGYASRISGDLQEGLPDFKVVVGPQEASDIPGYVKQVL